MKKSKITLSCGDPPIQGVEFFIEYRDENNNRIKIAKSVCIDCIKFYINEMGAKILVIYKY